MKPFKIKHFQSASPSKRFPAFSSLTAQEVSAQLTRIGKRLSIREIARIDIFRAIVSRMEPVAFPLAGSEEFRLEGLWSTAGVVPLEALLFSEDALESIDGMARRDVESAFDAIWYPISDDLLIWDDSIEWFVFIDHDGYMGRCIL